jgi:hypothetical protein
MQIPIPMRERLAAVRPALGWLALLAVLMMLPAAASAQILLPCGDPQGCPDLRSDGNALTDWVIGTQNFSASDCAYVEGEVGGTGERRLLRFTFATPNLGAGDVVIGNPQDRPELFEFSTCHGHAHFKEYADYRLWTTSGYNQWNALRAAQPNALPADLLAANPGLASQMTEGAKRGFCMIDIWDYGSSRPKRYTDCSFQGITVGWGDVYHQALDGQWIDITGVPDGNYVLEVEVNAERIIQESNYTNNRASLPITIAPPPAPIGLVAAYGFDENQGNQTADSSGQFNNGTVQGATWTTSGKFGNALVFNGTSSLVSIPDAPSLDLTSAMTLSAWVNPSGGLSGWSNVIKKEVDSYFLSAHTPNGGPGGGATIGGSCCPSARQSSPLALNTWTHLALTYDGSAVRLYRNGTLVSTTGASGQISPTSLPLRIGGDAVYGEFVQGRIDEVRIYDRALSPSEIQAIKDQPINQTGSILSISDAGVPPSEGDSGTSQMSFDVSLVPASAQTVTVQYGTANGTATAGSDYSATSGTLTFAPGETAKSVPVTVLGDTLSEGSETLFVDLTAATNAAIGRGRGVGTIVDDDPLPALSINDVTVTEGNSGSQSAAFTVNLSVPGGQTVTVQYATASGSATAGSDYSTTSGTLTFAPGDTAKTVNVSVLGDTASESSETFFVDLSAAVNATVSRARGVGTITDNDAATPSITVTAPNGGTWKIGTSKQIQWTSSAVSGNVKIELSRDGGATWAVLFASVANTGSQSWTVTGPATAAARIRVSSVNAPAVGDVSDANTRIK